VIIEKFGISVLNVAGPRESDEPGVYRFVSRFLDQALGGAPQRLIAPTRRG
jgi:Circularly permutated YpsA SLOG family